jgi:hypothetical protein
MSEILLLRGIVFFIFGAGLLAGLLGLILDGWPKIDISWIAQPLVTVVLIASILFIMLIAFLLPGPRPSKPRRAGSGSGFGGGSGGDPEPRPGPGLLLGSGEDEIIEADALDVTQEFKEARRVVIGGRIL